VRSFCTPRRDEDATLFPDGVLLHGLAEHCLISRNRLTAGAQFKDLLSSMFTMPSFGEDDGR
jgi:magnesium chelatase subunit I